MTISTGNKQSKQSLKVSTTMPTTNGHPVDTGCVLSAPFGWHNHARMIAEAVALGYSVSDADQAVIDRYDNDNSEPDSNDPEVVADLMDQAEAWLNDHTPSECLTCGQPVERTDSGAWWVHVGLQGDCPTRFADTARHYLWHWSDGEFYLSVLCEDSDSCIDDTCAHWSFQ